VLKTLLLIIDMLHFCPTLCLILVTGSQAERNCLSANSTYKSCL